MKSNWILSLLIFLGIAFIAVARLDVINIPNFAPIAAAGIIGVYYFQDKKWGFILPLAALFISDIILQSTKGYGLYPARSVDYLGFLFAIAIGFFIFKRWKGFPAIFGATVFGSLAFFIISNFGVWVIGNMYPKTLVGLLACFEMAIPFYRNTIVGDLFFVTVFYGVAELVLRFFPKEKLSTSH